jgi:hypothetical protein
LGDGPPCFRRDSSCPAVLRIRSGGNEVSTTGLSPSLAGRSRPVRLPRPFLTPIVSGPTTPRGHASWFGLFPFRSPLLGESRLLSSPPGTKMFQFPGCALHALWIQAWILPHYGQWVPPFGHLRINACLQLPEAFRRLPRPSSAPSAKASTVRPFQLNLLRSRLLPYCLASARRRSGSNNLRLRDVNIPPGEEHLPIAAKRSPPLFRLSSFQGTRLLLEFASLQSCAEESCFPEPASRRRHRRKATTLKQLPCSFAPRNPASLNSLVDADAKQLKEFLIPSKLNETEARFALNND